MKIVVIYSGEWLSKQNIDCINDNNVIAINTNQVDNVMDKLSDISPDYIFYTLNDAATLNQLKSRFPNTKIITVDANSSLSYYFNYIIHVNAPHTVADSIPPSEEQRARLDAAITRAFYAMGVPIYMSGAMYLRLAVRAVLDDSRLTVNADELFKLVAVSCGTTASKVSRSVRHAIEVAWHGVEYNLLPPDCPKRVKLEAPAPQPIFLIVSLANYMLKIMNCIGDI